MPAKVIAFYESKWIDSKTDFRQWDHLCRSFYVELQMIHNWEEALVPDGHIVVVLDETGNENLEVFAHPENVVYVFGRSGWNEIQNDIPHDTSVRIETPASIALFGISAASFVLYDRLRGSKP